MFILKTSLSLLLFFVFIIYFTIRKVNPLCEKIIYTRKKVGGRPTSPAESRTSLSGLYTFTPSGHEIRHKRLTRFCASQSSFKTGSLLIPGNPGRIGSRSFPTSHESRITNHKKALAYASAFFIRISGFLSSQGASPQVLSAFAGLTAVFGMGTGGSPQLSPLNYIVQDVRILTTA